MIESYIFALFDKDLIMTGKFEPHNMTVNEISRYIDVLDEKSDLWHLTQIRFDMDANKFSALCKLIKKANKRCLSITDSEIGKMPLPRWRLFCTALLQTKLEELVLDSNQLEKFSVSHWIILTTLFQEKISRYERARKAPACTDSKPAKPRFLSLQNNNLVALSSKQYDELKKLVYLLKFPCHISNNNWAKNMNRWIELTNRNGSLPHIAQAYRFISSHKSLTNDISPPSANDIARGYQSN